MGKTRIEIDRFEGTGDFSLWKVRMMAHFGVLGLKDILTDETLLLDPPKEEAEGDTKVTGDGTTESSSKIDPAKLEKSEKAKDLIIVNVGNQVLRKISHCETAAAMWTALNTLILGMDIIRDRKKGILKLSQENYLEKVLKSFNMTEAKAVNTPTSTQFKLKSLTKDQKEEEGSFMADIPYASVVGSIMYAMVGSRPDLGYAVGLISRFMSEPGREHWLAAKWVLRYLKGATKRCLTFTKHSEFSIQGFCDSDYATDLDRRRSVTGFVFQVWGNTRRLIHETQVNLIGERIQGRLINYHHQEEIRDSKSSRKKNSRAFSDEESYRVMLRWWEFSEDRAEDLGKNRSTGTESKRERVVRL
ncbi:hypothetical protein YC2023_044633 [Brassica napus]